MRRLRLQQNLPASIHALNPPAPLDAEPDANEKGGRLIRSCIQEILGVKTDDFFDPARPSSDRPNSMPASTYNPPPRFPQRYPSPNMRLNDVGDGRLISCRPGWQPVCTHFMQYGVEENRHKREMPGMERGESGILRVPHR